MTQFLQLLVSGIAAGCVYALVALGFVLVYKATEVFNMAHGYILMLAPYFMISALATQVPLIPAMVMALALVLIVGYAMERFLIRPMIGQEVLSVIVLTIAVGLVIHSVVVIFWGPSAHALSSSLPNETLLVAGLRISTLDLIVLGTAIACMLGFALFFRHSKLGLHMRATAESSETATLAGINVKRVYTVAFLTGSGMAGIGGLLLANVQVLTPSIAEIGLLALPAVVIGGLNSIPGAVVGGLVVGLLQQYSAAYLSSTISTAVVYAVLLLMIQFRPAGLLGTPEVARV